MELAFAIVSRFVLYLLGALFEHLIERTQKKPEPEPEPEPERTDISPLLSLHANVLAGQLQGLAASQARQAEKRRQDAHLRYNAHLDSLRRLSNRNHRQV